MMARTQHRRRPLQTRKLRVLQREQRAWLQALVALQQALKEQHQHRCRRRQTTMRMLWPEALPWEREV